MQFIAELMGPAYFDMLDRRAFLDLVVDWEKEKCTVSGVSDDDDTIFVRMHEIIDNLAEKTEDKFCKGDLDALVQAYNEKHKYTGDNGA